MKKVLAVAVVLGAAALLVPNAHAACSVSTPMFHGLDSYLACDNSRGPVTGFAYQVASPVAHNSGTDTITSELGPGTVQINTDWADDGVVGCPNIGGLNTRILISVQASDGTGVLLSLSGADPGVGYLVEAGHTFDPDSGLAFPLACDSRNGRPIVRSMTANSVTIHVDPPQVYSDCDPDSVGMVALGGTTCPDGFGTTADGATVGGIYTSNQPCGTKPIVARTSWQLTAATLDAGGDATVLFNKPTDGSCVYIGTTLRLGTVEGQSITGFIQVAGALAAPPTAEGVRAAADAGKVRLSWSTSNEVGLAGFRLIGVSKSKGQFEIGSLIAAKGSPSSYTAEARMGDLKGSRSIIIRSILTDGTSVDAAPVNF